MFFDLIKRLRGNFVFRLSLWYALIFTASTAGLFVLIYFLVEQEFERKDRHLMCVVHASATEESFEVAMLPLWNGGPLAVESFVWCRLASAIQSIPLKVA